MRSWSNRWTRLRNRSSRPARARPILLDQTLVQGSTRKAQRSTTNAEMSKTASLLLVFAAVLLQAAGAQTPAFTYQHVMVPVRDGIKLETVVMAPANARMPL